VRASAHEAAVEEFELPLDLDPEPVTQDPAAAADRAEPALPLDDREEDEPFALDALIDDDAAVSGDSGEFTPAPEAEDVDLDSLLDQLGGDSGSEPGAEAADSNPRGPRIDLPDDADLDSLFDEIQLEE
jgi:hypothetical protein